MATLPISEDDIQKKAKAFEESEYKRKEQERIARINHFVVLNEQMIDNHIISLQNKGLKPPYEIQFLIWSLNIRGGIYHFNYHNHIKICNEFNIDPNDENPEIQELYCIMNLSELKCIFDKITETYKKAGWLPGPLIDTPLTDYGRYVNNDSTYDHSYTFYLETLESVKEKEAREIIIEKENIEKENKRKKLIAKKKIEDLRKQEERKHKEKEDNIKWNMTEGAKSGALWGGMLGFISGFISCVHNNSQQGHLNWDFFTFSILGIIIGVIIGIINGANTPNRKFKSTF